ncbi:hypothetical protein [Pseudanabaena sp. UWO310]|uniref:hypothetical protein n=1 Tax=Pseudanabaena sp. UWO310 TaxID=2480795 RepID=UPI00115A50EB|nr:hypothetical protein [Pseudanabaena sp. UWO310]TYQ30102.1 hypothetical protein PseudUWO310_10590 [Pseudanabaena sp. UWO310]
MGTDVLTIMDSNLKDRISLKEKIENLNSIVFPLLSELIILPEDAIWKWDYDPIFEGISFAEWIDSLGAGITISEVLTISFFNDTISLTSPIRWHTFLTNKQVSSVWKNIISTIANVFGSTMAIYLPDQSWKPATNADNRIWEGVLFKEVRKKLHEEGESYNTLEEIHSLLDGYGYFEDILRGISQLSGDRC